MHNWPLVKGNHRLTVGSSKMANNAESVSILWRHNDMQKSGRKFHRLNFFVVLGIWMPFYNIGINYKKFTIKLPRAFMYTQYAYSVDRMNASLYSSTATSQWHGVSNHLPTYGLFNYQLVQANTQENIKDLHYWHFVKDIHRWLSHPQESVMRVSMTWRPRIQCMCY